MKYFIDTEFLEGPQEPKWLMLKSRLGHWMIGKPKPTIDLISIGIVAEDGREYYAISKDFNLKEAWNKFQLDDDYDANGDLVKNIKKVYWIRENVLRPIFYEFVTKDMVFSDYDDYMFLYSDFKKLLNRYGKTNKKIAEDVKDFCGSGNLVSYHNDSNKPFDVEHTDSEFRYSKYTAKGDPKFYAYYADYDWVVFCWLFGKMMDLPKGFPMYCKDLKQILDDKAMSFLRDDIMKFSIELQDFEAVKSGNYKDYISALKNSKNFPKQDSSKLHNAIEDARWNKQLFEFLTQL